MHSEVGQAKNPENVVPVTFSLTEPTVTLKPNSYTVVELGCDGLAGISEVSADAIDSTNPVIYYNLSGSEVKNPSNGVYVTSDGKKIAL